MKGNQHIFYPVWPRPPSLKETFVKGNFQKRSSYAFQYTNCKRAPNYNDGQTFQFHEMELLVLLHEIDMHISRFRLPATLLKKAKNSSHSGGGNIRRNKMISGRRTVLSGWTTISTKTSFMKTSGKLCKNLCKVSKVFRGVLDSDPGCPNEPEDLCYHGRFFLWSVSRWKNILSNFQWNFNFEKDKKKFSVLLGLLSNLKFNLTTSNAGCCCCYSFFVKGDEFLSLHYSNWERFLEKFFFTHSSLWFSRLSMSQYSNARSRRRAKW